MERSQRLRTAGTLEEVAAVLLPGSSRCIAELRASAIALASDSLARGAVLIGPPGTGKSTLARAIGLCRYLYLLKPAAFSRVLKSVRFDGWGRLTIETMDWYREISLTGLVEPLADTQLFGIAKGVASEVGFRDGLFKLAMNGLPSSDDPTLGAQATGGVVFLDELGDLPPVLQPKLLSVLSGGVLYPVGREGVLEAGYTYRGLTITATWRELSLVRPDLLARVSDHVIQVPTLNERIEDLPELTAMVLEGIKAELTAQAKRLQAPNLDDIDASRLVARPAPAVEAEDVAALSAVDWDKRGDLRGLTQVLRTACAYQIPIREALGRHPARPGASSRESPLSGILSKVLEDASSGATLQQIVGKAEHQLRCELADYLRAHPGDLTRLTRKLGLRRDVVLQQVRDLTRDRRRR